MGRRVVVGGTGRWKIIELVVGFFEDILRRANALLGDANVIY